MLCDHCKKNQASQTYTQTRGGRVEQVHYCLECDALLRKSCPYCGTTASDFSKTKLVGCANCYQALSDVILAMVEGMQGSIRHTGKRAYQNKQERIKQRCEELSTLAEKSYSENDDRGAGVYEERIDMLMAGLEEDFVWQKTRKFNR